MKRIRKAEKITFHETFYEVLTDCAPLRLWFLTDDIIRIRAGFDGDFDEASYALMTTAWESRTDELFRKERQIIKPADCVLEKAWENGESQAVIQGKRLKVVIEKAPFALKIYDRDGSLIHEDLPEIGYREDPNGRRIHSVRISPRDHFYGFGEKTGSLDKAGEHLRMTQGDSIGYDPEKTDGMYKHVPFYIRLSEDGTQAAGYFYHTTSFCSFDLGKALNNYRPRNAAFSADAGDIDLFFIAGPEIKDVIQRYTYLTGRPAMLPKAALGYLGSSMYYAELPEKCDEGILKFTDLAQKEGIPMDGFQLSSGYCSVETEEGIKRCTFTWNDDRFPDPSRFFEKMGERGIAVSANVKPGMLLVHPLMQEMQDADMFIHDPEDPEKLCEGAWWGGPGYFMDYTRKETREKWKEMLKQYLFSYGCPSIWNDNCEYDSLADLDAPVSFDGKGGTSGELKSIMANLMCKLSNEATLEYDPNLRPFSVCRAGFAGIQQYAQVWTGDNPTGWPALKGNLGTMLNMGLSGMANTGSDVGGFFGPAPERELFLRWVQHGIFMPRFSIHSANSDNTVTEPWMYSDIREKIASAIRLRYAFRPYLYSLMVRAHEEGLPIMEPLLLNFAHDKNTHGNRTEFFFGDSLLVANVLEKGAVTRKLYLPEGVSFYDFYTRKPYAGGQEIEIPVDEDSIPMFLRSGAIVPMSADAGFFREEKGDPGAVRMTDPVKNLQLILVPDRDGSFILYDDDGVSNDYEAGVYRRTQIDMKASDKASGKIEVQFTASGSYASRTENILLDVVCDYKAPYYVKAAGSMLPRILYREDFEKAEEGWYYSNRLHSALIRFRNPGTDAFKVEIATGRRDLIGMG